MSQRIDYVCPKHPNRVAMLDVCNGCMEERFGPLTPEDVDAMVFAVVVDHAEGIRHAADRALQERAR